MHIGETGVTQEAGEGQKKVIKGKVGGFIT